MRRWIEYVILLALIYGIASLVWFALGATAAFQRSLDIIGTTLLMLFAIPLLLMILMFVRGWAIKWTPKNVPERIGLVLVIIVMLGFSTTLFQHVGTRGWITEMVDTDALKKTEDRKYEYRIELVNLFQRNSKARLYLRDTETGEEKRIPVDIRTREIRALSIGEDTHWGMLEPADAENRYILTTTSDLRIHRETFEIDVEAGTARRLE
jgi:hypothetical protein